MSSCVFVNHPTRMTLQWPSGTTSVGAYTWLSHRQACTNNRHQKRPNLPLEGLLFTPWVIFAAMRALFVLLTSQLVSLNIGQTNFGSSQQNPNPSSDVNTRLFTGHVILIHFSSLFLFWAYFACYICSPFPILLLVLHLTLWNTLICRQSGS